MFKEPEAIQHEPALATLAALCEPFGDGDLACRGVEFIDPASMPETYRRLLGHSAHMTATLKEYHGGDVALRVLAYHDEWPWYERKIILTASNSRKVVEFGIVRLDLRVLTEEVRAEVLQRSKPLGAILNDHRVLTRVEPRWFLKFGADSPMKKYLRFEATGACYGRLATIHCDGAAAIDLLEVVTDFQ